MYNAENTRKDSNFHNKIIKERREKMMEMFFAQRVILGKSTFDDIPQVLRHSVAEILLDSGLMDLVPEEYKEGV